MAHHDLYGVDKLGRFDDGRYQAERVCKHATHRVKGSLKRAQESRRNLITRLFRPGKRRYLDGFIARLEEELRRRAEGVEPGTSPIEHPGSASTRDRPRGG